MLLLKKGNVAGRRMSNTRHPGELWAVLDGE